jgi:TetR/AcrR family transcriptional regulator
MAKKKAKARSAGKGGVARDPSTTPDAEARILEAARSVFIRRGTAGARMQEIAAEAGVNQALLHYYFRSKDQLAAAVFGQMASRLFPALLLTLSGDAPLDQKIEQLIALYHENLSRNPFLPAYVLAEMHHHPERIQQVIGKVGGGEPRAVVLPMFAKLAEQIDVEVRAGRMRPITPQSFVVNLVSLCIFPFAARPMLGFMLGLDDDAFPTFIQERQRTLAEFFRNALRP